MQKQWTAGDPQETCVAVGQAYSLVLRRFGHILVGASSPRGLADTVGRCRTTTNDHRTTTITSHVTL